MNSSELYNLHLEIKELSSLSQELVEPLLVNYDLTSVQYRALQLIVLNESIAVKDVSNHLKIKPAAGTALIDRLERKKMIERVHSEDDRRVVFIQSTESGREAYHSINKSFAKIFSDYYSVLNEEETERLKQIVGKLTEHVSSRIENKI
ncbi:MarR family transcriptional regulator [Peribacillus simplex]|uniref:MarR family transcriptional regulator n=2 Tax=Peribacillus TaxID=2675229 RepID=A0AA90PC07_9BACI|nr:MULTISPECIES: MarR family transcriptional regulator [Peribacillus]MDP1421293.1 MarR family transcriptional regulator [Peribacillus simplex]MDP1452988.1 MarR family transcriptional regulator [Peribacillus frigoritolerans]